MAQAKPNRIPTATRAFKVCWLCDKEGGGVCAHCKQPVCLDAEPEREGFKPGCWTIGDGTNGLSCIVCKEELGLTSDEERAIIEQEEDVKHDGEMTDLLAKLDEQDKGAKAALRKMARDEER